MRIRLTSKNCLGRSCVEESRPAISFTEDSFFASLSLNAEEQLLRLFCEIQSNFLARAIHISILSKRKLPDQR